MNTPSFSTTSATIICLLGLAATPARALPPPEVPLAPQQATLAQSMPTDLPDGIEDGSSRRRSSPQTPSTSPVSSPATNTQPAGLPADSHIATPPSSSEQTAPLPQSSPAPSYYPNTRPRSSSAPSRVEPSAPSDNTVPSALSPAPQEVGVLALDGKGLWTPHNAPNADFSQLPNASRYLVFWKDIFNASVAQGLSEKQLATLLSNPTRLTSSRFASSIIRPDLLVFVGIHEGSRYAALKIDVATSTQSTIVAPTDMTETQANTFLLRYCFEGQAPSRVPVIANQNSNVYHLPNALHLHQNVPTTSFADRSQAEKAGFRPCTICFDDANNNTRLSQSERQQRSQASREIENHYRLSQDQAAIKRANDVAARVMAANQLNVYDYRVILLDSDEMDSFSAPGGPIYLTSAFLSALESDDEIAAVLGHEIALVKMKNVEKSRNTRTYTNWAGDLLGYATGNYWISLGTRAAGSFMNKRSSRQNQSVADDVALYMAYSAGYQPDDFLLTLYKIGEIDAKTGKRSGPSWFRSELTASERIDQVKRVIAEIHAFDAKLAPVLQRGDQGLATNLRSHAREYQRSPQDLAAFLQAYSALNLPALPAAQPTSDKNAPNAPAPQPAPQLNSAPAPQPPTGPTAPPPAQSIPTPTTNDLK